MSSLDSLRDLLEEELKDIYDAEKQLTKALPKMATKASSAELTQAFKDHLQQTKNQLARIEEVFKHLEMPARGKPCVGMKNLIKEGDEMIADAEEPATRDAVMIAAAQKVEHYEIASYGTVRSWAQLLGLKKVASLLEESLSEERETDEKLTALAEGAINADAAAEGDRDQAAADQSEGSQRAWQRETRARSTARSPRHQAADPGRSGHNAKRSRS